MKIQALAGLAALALFSLPAAAQTLKPGLWEITQKVGGNPQMDQEMAQMQKEMAGMSPAERKQMEAMMSGQGVKMGPGGGGGGMSIKMCMTREMVERNEMPAQQDDCKTTRQSRSGNTLKMAFACTNPPSTGESEVTISSPEAYRSKMVMTSQVKGKPEKMSMEGSGKWLGADCGTVKPVVPPKR